MRFGSVCSGIEAASVAWGPLGFEAAWLSEIEPFPCALLAHHYPTVPNLGDMATIASRIASGEVEAPDLFCGGTPCQAFSVAGLRNSLDDARGNLALVFCDIANAVDAARSVRNEPPAIVFWENVPGVLSTKDNAFGCFLAGLAGEDDPLVAPGGKWTNAGCVFGPQRTVAWRVLDAQYFGVAQRRRRVFVVASARNGFDPAAVLFEFDGVRRDIAPSRQAGQSVTGTLSARTEGGGGLGTDFDLAGGVQPVVAMAHGQGGAEIAFDRSPTLTCNHEAPIACITGDITHTLKAEGFDASEDGTGRGTPIVPVLPFDTTQVTSPANYSKPQPGDPCHPLAAGAHPPAIAFNMHKSGHEASSLGISEDRTDCLRAFDKSPFAVQATPSTQVRRLTPRECERLQGFPDSYTDVPYRKKPAADGPRYKALGNSWAVPNVRWIGERIKAAL